MAEKACTGCGTTKPLGEFYAAPKGKDGRASKCKECAKAAVKANYAVKRPEKSAYEYRRTRTPERRAYLVRACQKHRKRNPEKYAARTAVNNAIRDGRLVKGPCKHCRTDKRVQAHHADYSKPLDVTWECFRCHREVEHGQEVTAPSDGREGKAA
jgi:hypothetical protein